MIYRKSTIWNRIVSLALAIMIVVGTAFCDVDTLNVLADTITSGVAVVSYANGNYTISASGGSAVCTLSRSESGNVIYYQDSDGRNQTDPFNSGSIEVKDNVTLYVESGSLNSIVVNNGEIILNASSISLRRLTIQGEGKVTINGKLSSESIIDEASTTSIIVGENGSFEGGSFSPNGSVINNGKMSFGDGFSSVNAASFENNGSVEARSMSLGDTTTDSTTATFIAQNSFYKADIDLLGVVEVSSLTSFTSDGGEFTLKIFDATRKMSGEIDTNSVYEVFYEDSAVTLGDLFNVFVGELYDFKDKIGFADGYSGTPYLEYKGEDTTEFSGDKPETPGTYSVKAVAPADNYWTESESSEKEFTISYLPLTAVPNGEFKYGGIENGVYAADKVTVYAPEGFHIRPYWEDDFSESVSFSINDLYNEDGNFNQDITFGLKKIEGGAETENILDYQTYAPLLDDVIFDDTDPELLDTVIDGNVSPLANGDVITAKKMTLSFGDEYLDKAIIDDGTNKQTVSFSGESTVESIDLEGTWGVVKNCNVTVYDKSGRTVNSVFTLKYPLASVTASVAASDVCVGTEVEPVVTTVSDGKSDTEFLYKLAGSDDSTYTSTKPTKAGKYIVKALVPETLKYEATSCIGTFTISKIVPSLADVKVADILVGQDVAPVVTTDSDGGKLAKYEYKSVSTPDDTFTDVVPTAAGEYTVRATIPETDAYEAVTCSGNFTISRHTVGESRVEIPDVYVGADFDPVLTTDSDGKDLATFEYTSDGTTYSLTKPTAAGTYTVRATIPETSKYKMTACYDTFTIMKRIPATASVSVADIKVGGTISPVVNSESDGKTSALFVYKPYGADDREFTETAPTKAGKYTVRAVIPETDTYVQIICETTFVISKNIPSVMSLQINNGLVGTDLSPVFETDSDGKASVVIEYKSKDASDKTYSTTQPTKQGTYVARATVPETDAYESSSCIAEFTMNYLAAPELAYTLSGKEGKNDFYVGDVTVNAPDGFSISRTLGGTYASSFTYSVSLKTVYLRRNSDGALTDGISFDKEVKIDKLSPTVSVMTDQDGNAVVGTNKIYADTLNVKVTDENLDVVTLDGTEVTVSNNAGTAFLDSENGEKTFKIDAEDLAGNVFSTNVTLTATWLIEKVIPANELVPLKPGVYYKLGDGQWTVDGDSTVYSGGGEVYVSKEDSYTFTPQ